MYLKTHSYNIKAFLARFNHATNVPGYDFDFSPLLYTFQEAIDLALLAYGQFILVQVEAKVT